MRSTIALVCSVLLAACGNIDVTGFTGTYPGRVVITSSSAGPLTSAGESREVTAVVTGADGTIVRAPALTWTSSAPGVATVTGSGANATITAVDDGKASIFATDGVSSGVVTITVHRRLTSLVTLMNRDRAYVDVHTTAHPDGELRGQIFGPTD